MSLRRTGAPSTYTPTSFNLSPPTAQWRERQSAALEGDQCRSVGDRASPPAAKPGRRSGLGEQDGTHRLGGDAPAGELPAYGRSGINPKLRTRACERQ